MHGEVALCHEVAVKLLRCGHGDAALWGVRLKAVCMLWREDFEEELVDAAFSCCAGATLGRRLEVLPGALGELVCMKIAPCPISLIFSRSITSLLNVRRKTGADG